tara:strand:- start:3391 stop:4443 length:1053 start_codon:yes stop_codon:yes gene_type:complete
LKFDYVFIFPSLKRNGGNRVLLSALKVISSREKNCKLLYIDSDENKFEVDESIKCSSLKLNSNSSFLKIAYLFLLCVKASFNSKKSIIFISDPIISCFVFLFFRFKVIRFVQADDENIFEKNEKANFIFKKVYKILFRLSKKFSYSKIIFNSHFTKKKYLEGINSSGIDYSVIFPHIIKHFLSPSNELTKSFITVGSSQIRKGLDDFIYLSRIKCFEDYEFKIISQENLELPEKISIINPKNDDEYLNALKSSSFFVNTSKFEGFGLPPIEAMSLGLILISYPNEAVKIILKDEEYFAYRSKEDLLNLKPKIDKIFEDIEIYKNLRNQSLRISSIYSYENFKNGIIDAAL